MHRTQDVQLGNRLKGMCNVPYSTIVHATGAKTAACAHLKPRAAPNFVIAWYYRKQRRMPPAGKH